MRSIFDQYSAPENRLTHALGCCLERDRRLLRAFIRWATGTRALPTGRLEVLEQQIPGTPVASWDEDESRGLPDLWIHDGASWSLLVESKVKAAISSGQLRRHLKTAQRNGFTDIDLVVLAPELPAHRLADVTYRTWPQVYSWLRRRAGRSEWAACMARYMEVAEERMTADGYLGDQPLTEFDGVPFGPDHPYSYREAKRALRLAMDELRKRPDLRKLGMNPTGPGRPAITGREGTGVWDFLPLKESDDKPNFTACPHLTLGVQDQAIRVIVTLPNATPAPMRKNLTGRGIEEFGALVCKVEVGVSRAVRGLKSAHPIIEAIQRHFPSQRSKGIEDARLEFDLRTIAGSPRHKVRRQGQWLEAVYSVLTQKRSNFQVGIGALLPYGDQRLQSRDVLEVIAKVWTGCKPWLDTILGRSKHRKTRRGKQR